MDSMSELLSTPQRRFYAAAGLPVLLLLLLGLTGPVLAVLMAFAAGYFVAFPGANAFADKSAAYEEELACLRRRRSAGGPPGGPPDCQAAGDAYALRTPAPPQTAVPAPVKLSASGALDPHVTALVDHVVRDYVMSWYGALCAPPPSEDGAAAAAASDAVAPAQEFPNAVKGALYQVVGSLAAHLGKSDPARLAVLTGYCVSHLLIVHMREYRRYEAANMPLAEYVLQNPTSPLTDLASPRKQAETLRATAGYLITRLLPPSEARSLLVRSILKEVLAMAGLSRMLDAMVDPDRINQAIIGGIGGPVPSTASTPGDEPYMPTGAKDQFETPPSGNPGAPENREQCQEAVDTGHHVPQSRADMESEHLDALEHPSSSAASTPSLEKPRFVRPSLSLSDVLDRQEAFDKFHKHLLNLASQDDQSFAVAYLKFWTNSLTYAQFATALSAGISGAKPVDIGDPNFAADICNDHFGPKARYPIPAPPELVASLEAAIRSGSPGGRCFLPLRKHVREVLQRDFWPSFTCSPEFAEHCETVGRVFNGQAAGADGTQTPQTAASRAAADSAADAPRDVDRHDAEEDHLLDNDGRRPSAGPADVPPPVGGVAHGGWAVQSGAETHSPTERESSDFSDRRISCGAGSEDDRAEPKPLPTESGSIGRRLSEHGRRLSGVSNASENAHACDPEETWAETTNAKKNSVSSEILLLDTVIAKLKDNDGEEHTPRLLEERKRELEENHAELAPAPVADAPAPQPESSREEPGRCESQQLPADPAAEEHAATGRPPPTGQPEAATPPNRRTSGAGSAGAPDGKPSLLDVRIRVTDTTNPGAFSSPLAATMASDRSLTYILEVERPGGTGGWIITRTYADFASLHAELSSALPKAAKLKFPSRSRMQSGGGVLEKLVADLEGWLNLAVTDASLRDSAPLGRFLKPDWPVGGDRKEGGSVAGNVLKANVMAATSVLKRISSNTTNAAGYLRDRSNVIASSVMGSVGGSTPPLQASPAFARRDGRRTQSMSSAALGAITKAPDAVRPGRFSTGRFSTDSLMRLEEAASSAASSPRASSVAPSREPQKRGAADPSRTAADRSSFEERAAAKPERPREEEESRQQQQQQQPNKELTEHELDLLLETIFAVLEEVFDMADSSMWLRRKALNIGKQLLRQRYGSRINQAFADWVCSHTREQAVADALAKFLDDTWPPAGRGGPAPPPGERTEEEKARARAEAHVLLVSKPPDILQKIVGGYNCKLGLSRLFNLLQHRAVLKGLAVQILDGVVKLVLGDAGN